MHITCSLFFQYVDFWSTVLVVSFFLDCVQQKLRFCEILMFCCKLIIFFSHFSQEERIYDYNDLSDDELEVSFLVFGCLLTYVYDFFFYKEAILGCTLVGRVSMIMFLQKKNTITNMHLNMRCNTSKVTFYTGSKPTI